MYEKDYTEITTDEILIEGLMIQSWGEIQPHMIQIEIERSIVMDNLSRQTFDFRVLNALSETQYQKLTNEHYYKDEKWNLNQERKKSKVELKLKSKMIFKAVILQLPEAEVHTQFP